MGRALPILCAIGATLALAATARTAAGNTASVRSDGYSFVFDDGFISTFGVDLYFTTWDGSTALPLGCCDDDLSGEISPSTPGATTYRTDYLLDDFGIYEYGAVQVTVSAADGDDDGILDPLQRSLPGNFTMSGSSTCHFNNDTGCLNATVNAQVTRSAGSMSGTYSGSFTNAFGTASFSGPFELSGAYGSLDYTVGGDTIDWSLQDDFGRTVTGQSGIVRNGTTSITIPSFTLSRLPEGDTITTSETTLTRFGSVYRGRIDLVDGEPTTPFADYTSQRLEIEDPNDEDGDGVPDLSAVPEPSASWTSAAALLGLAGLASRERRRPAGPDSTSSGR